MPNLWIIEQDGIEIGRDELKEFIGSLDLDLILIEFIVHFIGA